jgi:uncharacterized membrane protein YdfJ with MMPL/SSD domain
MLPPPVRRPNVGDRVFGGLGRAVVRHPWYPIIFWVALFIIAIPFLSLLGSVTTSSTTSLPSSAPSSQAQAELNRLFPNEGGGSSSILVISGPNVTSATAQGALENITDRLLTDRSLTEVESITSVYTSAAGYLAGQAGLTHQILQSALNGSTPTPPLLGAINQSAGALWGPPAAYVANWRVLVNESPSDPERANLPAYNVTRASFANQTLPLQVLSAFYLGSNGTTPGFNATPACWTLTAVAACASAVARTTEAPLIPLIEPSPAQQLVPRTALATLNVANFTTFSSVQGTAAEVLNQSVGTPPGFLLEVWNAFGARTPTSAALGTWANATVAMDRLWQLPIPIPFAITSQFVNPASTASLIVVSYAVSDSYTNASGGNPVFADVDRLNQVVPGLLAASDPTHSLSFAQTGGPALDQNENQVLSASLAIVLPITVSVLILITMLYFRSPVTPLFTFAGIAIALVLGLAGTVLVGTLVTHVDSTALTLVETFVLGVGTDYSVFIVARYREELINGREPKEAVVMALTWAGQSVATSGSTAIIATLALAFSGVALLSQWGSVLSLAIFLTVALSLTLVPAFLTLAGPRIFWPTTRARFERHAQRARERIAAENTYFYRVGRLAQRHPKATVGVILLISIPLVFVAVQVPLSYDFYQQLPAGQPAIDGLNLLNQHFAGGFAFPSFALVTMAAPLFPSSNSTNASEFATLAAVTELAATTSGIAAVQSPVGPYGAPLSMWENFSSLPSLAQVNLHGIAESYLGNDGRTVLLSIVPTASGLSEQAISSVNAIQSRLDSYATTHAAVQRLAFGGSAPTTRDLAAQTFTATERMVLLVSIGLILVLLVVLRSWIIPLMAVATIGLSLSWAWSLTYLLFGSLFGLPLFFYVPTVLFILILGLGIDYNIFLLTRVREERLRGRSSSDATVEAVGRTGGIITAAAVILACAFAILLFGSFTLLRAIGFSVAIAILIDAMIVRTYLVPASLHLLGDRAWRFFGQGKVPESAERSVAPTETRIAPPRGGPSG